MSKLCDIIYGWPLRLQAGQLRNFGLLHDNSKRILFLLKVSGLALGPA